MMLISKIVKLDDGKGGEWVSEGAKGQFKGIIFRPGHREFSRKEMKTFSCSSSRLYS